MSIFFLITAGLFFVILFITAVNHDIINKFNKRISKSYNEIPKEKMIKQFALLFAISLSLSFVTFVCSSDETTKPEIKSSMNESISGNIKDIIVSYDTQNIINGKLKHLVWIENKSNYIFSGNISIKFKSTRDNSKVGSDTVFVENLMPSGKTYAIIWSKPIDDIIIENEWSSIKFTEDKISKDGKFDKYLTDEVNNYFSSNFGNPQMSASWYPLVKKIDAYSTDSLYWIVVTINTKTKMSKKFQSDLDNVAGALTHSGQSKTLYKVELISEDGKILKTLSENK